MRNVKLSGAVVVYGPFCARSRRKIASATN